MPLQGGNPSPVVVAWLLVYHVGAFEKLSDGLVDLSLSGTDKSWTGHENQVPTLGWRARLKPHRFPQQPLGPVSDHRRPHFFAGHKATATGRGGSLRFGYPPTSNQNGERVGMRSSFTPHPLDVS